MNSEKYPSMMADCTGPGAVITIDSIRVAMEAMRNTEPQFETIYRVMSEREFEKVLAEDQIDVLKLQDGKL